MTRLISPAQQEEIIRMYVEAEMGGPSIARETGISIQTVYKVLSRNGIKTREYTSPGTRDDIDWEKVAKLYQDTDISVNDLSLQFGVTRYMLNSILQSMGVPMRRLDLVRSLAKQQALERATQAYLNGVKVRIICNETGVSPSYLYKEVTARNLKFRQPRT